MQKSLQKLLYNNVGKIRYFMIINSAYNINSKSLQTFQGSKNQKMMNAGIIKSDNYGLDNDTVEIKNTENSGDNKKSKLLKWGALVGSGIVATTIGLLAHKHISVKNAKKAAEELKKIKLQELENIRAEKLKEEAKIAQEKALKAQEEAREKAIQAAKQKAEQEAKVKAEKQAKLEAARKAETANRSFRYNTEKELAQYIDPKGEISHNNSKLDGESFEAFRARINEEIEKIDVFDFGQKIKDTEPQTVFNVVFEQFEKCHNNGGNVSVDDFLKTLDNAKSQMYITYHDFSSKGSYGTSKIYDKFSDYKKYIDEVSAEIRAINKEGEHPLAVVRKALKSIENKNHVRQKFVSAVSQNYDKELGVIQGRLHYDETNVPPFKKEVTISKEEKQKLVDELNSILKSGGEQANYTVDTPLSTLQRAWKAKYISIPFSMDNKIGETAILDLFPRYRSGITQINGEDFKFKTSGNFKYEPLYRQMHIENPEEFVKQFENIGGEYVPGKLQSCSKEKLFGEAWNGTYNFTEWNSGNNVKFVIHPKGAISNAAEIGEGKYGSYEAIYSADSKFRIVGTIKRTITPEIIKRDMPEFRNQFDDFTKYEIHLQEI